MHISFSYAKILEETNFQTREIPRSGSKAENGEKKRKRKKKSELWHGAHIAHALPQGFPFRGGIIVLLLFLSVNRGSHKPRNMSEINHINLHVEVNDLTQHVAMKHPDSAATRDLNIDKDLTSVVISNTSFLSGHC